MLPKVHIASNLKALAQRIASLDAQLEQYQVTHEAPARKAREPSGSAVATVAAEGAVGEEAEQSEAESIFNSIMAQFNELEQQEWQAASVSGPMEQQELRAAPICTAAEVEPHPRAYACAQTQPASPAGEFSGRKRAKEVVAAEEPRLLAGGPIPSSSDTSTSTGEPAAMQAEVGELVQMLQRFKHSPGACSGATSHLLSKLIVQLNSEADSDDDGLESWKRQRRRSTANSPERPMRAVASLPVQQPPAAAPLKARLQPTPTAVAVAPSHFCPPAAAKQPSVVEQKATVAGLLGYLEKLTKALQEATGTTNCAQEAEEVGPSQEALQHMDIQEVVHSAITQLSNSLAPEPAPQPSPRRVDELLHRANVLCSAAAEAKNGPGVLMQQPAQQPAAQHREPQCADMQLAAKRALLHPDADDLGNWASSGEALDFGKWLDSLGAADFAVAGSDPQALLGPADGMLD